MPWGWGWGTVVQPFEVTVIYKGKGESGNGKYRKNGNIVWGDNILGGLSVRTI